jgi:hypothetical protein
MIKCEVVVDGDKILINGFSIYCSTVYQVCALEITMKTFETLEQAIQYCLSDGEGR